VKYSRCINFTLLAPSIWPLIEAFSNTEKREGYARYLCKTSQNTGIIYEIFLNKKSASENLDVLLAAQALKEQLLAKVAVFEGEII
tara:strand:- start:139 stop:396 length:258 start_codon:yes stop_codon:yes gene_type:complete